MVQLSASVQESLVPWYITEHVNRLNIDICDCAVVVGHSSILVIGISDDCIL